MKKTIEPKIKYFSFIEFLSIFCTLMILSSLPAMMYGTPFKQLLQNDYVLWYILYWLIVTCIICLITAWQKKKTFSKPLTKLRTASKAVASGDFSVYIEPIHSLDKRDYMDAMFEDFNHMVKELGSIETLKNDFISNVSHEIKTPLSIIQNYSALLKKDTLCQEEREEYLTIIMNATKKLTNLVSNILKLNKLENQEILSPSSSYDLCRQLSDCLLTFEYELERKHIEVHMDIEDKAMVKTEEDLMQIVWNNLFSNAIKFMEPGGSIYIKQQSEDDSILVEVRDTGCGMTEETLQHIFDKFYQGDTSHSQEGNGLGLALAYRIMEKTGGTISVTSKVKEGTSFFVRIPKDE